MRRSPVRAEDDLFGVQRACADVPVLRDPHTCIAHAFGLMVLTLTGDQVAEITGFADTVVFGLFGLPRTLPL